MPPIPPPGAIRCAAADAPCACLSPASQDRVRPLPEPLPGPSAAPGHDGPLAHPRLCDPQRGWRRLQLPGLAALAAGCAGQRAGAWPWCCRAAGRPGTPACAGTGRSAVAAVCSVPQANGAAAAGQGAGTAQGAGSFHRACWPAGCPPGPPPRLSGRPSPAPPPGPAGGRRCSRLTRSAPPYLPRSIPQLFTGATAALPCEVGPDGRPLRPARSQQAGGPFGFVQSKYQALWERRVQAQRQAREQQQQ
jgi:hypothetical protein